MHFALQSIEIKKLYLSFHPREICVDGTGLGKGLLDFLVMDQLGEDGVLYPSLGVINHDDYKKYAGPKVVYALIANSSENSEIHSNFYTQIVNGYCRFLISEQEAKSKLLATKKGAKMHPAERILRLAPHTETTRFFEEVCNLKVKLTGANTAVEQINRKINKDRFSSVEYALWRIKSFEDDYYRKKKFRKKDITKFLRFTNGRK